MFPSRQASDLGVAVAGNRYHRPSVGGSPNVIGGKMQFLRPDGEKEDALWLRDKHRDSYDNPDINVYRITVHEGCIERDEEQEVSA